MTFQRFLQAIERSHEGAIALHARAMLAKAKQRRKAGTKGEETRYVNIAGGPRNGDAVKTAMAWLQKQGLAAYGDVVKGPLLRATHGRLLSHMPLAADSSYTHIMGALRDAWEASQAMPEPDLDLALEGLDKPKWGHHSFRRTADKWARAAMEETGVDEDDIDELFGWKQKEREKDQQLHYAGPGERARRAHITMMT